MATAGAEILVNLNDSGRTVSDPAEDIRGRMVHDRDGDELGKIADLLVDVDGHKVRMLRVEHGGVLGIGATSSFIPAQAITGIDDEVVHVSESRARIQEAPRYDPDLVDQSEFYDSLYGYYGYAPFWRFPY